MSTFAEKATGGFLIGEAALSILFSEDKRALPQFARLVRIGIGYYIFSHGVTT